VILWGLAALGGICVGAKLPLAGPIGIRHIPVQPRFELSRIDPDL
jgi:hypothetical protein